MKGILIVIRNVIENVTLTSAAGVMENLSESVNVHHCFSCHSAVSLPHVSLSLEKVMSIHQTALMAQSDHVQEWVISDGMGKMVILTLT